MTETINFFMLTLRSEGRVAVEIFNVFFIFLLAICEPQIIFLCWVAWGVIFYLEEFLFVLGGKIFAVLPYHFGRRRDLLVLLT